MAMMLYMHHCGCNGRYRYGNKYASEFHGKVCLLIFLLHVCFDCFFFPCSEKQGHVIPLCEDLLESGSGSGSGGADLGLQTDDEDYIVMDGRRCHVDNTRCLIEVGLILCEGLGALSPSVIVVTEGFKSSLHNPAVVTTLIMASIVIIFGIVLAVVIIVQWRRLKWHRAHVGKGRTITRFAKLGTNRPSLRVVQMV